MNRIWLVVLLLPCVGFSQERDPQGFSQESFSNPDQVVIVEKKSSIKRRTPSSTVGSKSSRRHNKRNTYSDRPRVIHRKKEASSAAQSEVSKREQPLLNEGDALLEGVEAEKRKESDRPKVTQRKQISSVEKGFFSQKKWQNSPFRHQKSSKNSGRPLSKKRPQIRELMFSHSPSCEDRSVK